MPFLSHLCAQNGERIEDVALAALARLTTLRSLNLKGCRCVCSGQTTPSNCRGSLHGRGARHQAWGQLRMDGGR